MELLRRCLLFSSLLFATTSVTAQDLRFFEFGYRGLPDEDNLFAATSDSGVIHEVLAQLAVPEAGRHMFINGELQFGTGTNNPKYSWHFISNKWALAEIAIEACDAQPSDVENDKEYWITQFGRYCPNSSYVKREIFPLDVREPRAELIRLYPNPTNAVLHIDADETSAIQSVHILDALGKHVTVNWNGSTVDLSLLDSGLYYVVIRSKGEILVYKVSKI
jgi:hypothetical protein